MAELVWSDWTLGVAFGVTGYTSVHSTKGALYVATAVQGAKLPQHPAVVWSLVVWELSVQGEVPVGWGLVEIDPSVSLDGSLDILRHKATEYIPPSEGAE